MNLFSCMYRWAKIVFNSVKIPFFVLCGFVGGFYLGYLTLHNRLDDKLEAYYAAEIKYSATVDSLVTGKIKHLNERIAFQQALIEQQQEIIHNLIVK